MKLCVLIVGHKESSPGAVNEGLGMSEFAFNDKLSVDIQEALTSADVSVVRAFRKSYKQLPSDVNEMYPDFIISMHCNAFNRRASGTEVLHYHRSVKGAQMARILQAGFIVALGLKNRGVIACGAEDRGGYLLRYTKAPCVIAEPFFIDNSNDLRIALSKRNKLVEAYSTAIVNIVEEVF